MGTRGLAFSGFTASLTEGQRFGKLTLIHRTTIPKGTTRQASAAWAVGCDCGQVVIVRVCNLKTQKSCGCENPSKAAVQVNSHKVRERLRQYTHRHKKQRISQRDRPWELTDEQAIQMFLDRCRYCGELGTQKKPNGIDRIDSKLGYSVANTQSCCACCNRMKLTLTHDDFLKHMRRILKWVR